MHRPVSVPTPLVALLLCASLLAAPWLAPGLFAQDEGAEAEPAEEPLNNTLRWSTASEVDNFGYDIYRALSEEGPFERITERPIPGHGTTDETSRYEFVDDAIDPTRDYFYYVESIALDGHRERFTPVIKAAAKQPPPGDAEAEDEAENEDPEEGEGEG